MTGKFLFIHLFHLLSNVFKKWGEKDSQVIKTGEEIKQLTRIKALLSCPPGLP